MADTDAASTSPPKPMAKTGTLTESSPHTEAHVQVGGKGKFVRATLELTGGGRHLRMLGERERLLAQVSLQGAMALEVKRPDP